MLDDRVVVKVAGDECEEGEDTLHDAQPEVVVGERDVDHVFGVRATRAQLCLEEHVLTAH